MKASTLVVAALVAASLVACHKGPKGHVVALRAIDADNAIVAWGDGQRSWIGRVGADGARRWTRELAGMALADRNIVVGDGVVGVRYAHMEDRRDLDHAMAAFAYDDGAPLWDRTLAEIPHGEHAVPGLYVSGVALPGRFVEFVDRNDRHDVFGLDPRTGETWQHPWPHKAVLDAVVVGDHLVVWTLDNVVSISTTGAIASRATYGTGCRIGDDFVAIVQEADAPALVAFRGGDLAKQRVIAAPFEPLGPATKAAVSRCGAYRDRMVFTLARNLPFAGTIAVVDAAGKVVQRLDLGEAAWIHDEDGHAAPETTPFGGQLTRFVPFPIIDQKKNRLAIVDLEQGAIVHRSPEGADVRTISRSGDRWLVYTGLGDQGYAVIDGTTGRLDAAIVQHDTYGDEHRPWHAAGGKLWLSAHLDGDWKLAVLDVATLRPVYSNLEFDDATAKIRERFGMVPSTR